MPAGDLPSPSCLSGPPRPGGAPTPWRPAPHAVPARPTTPVHAGPSARQVPSSRRHERSVARVDTQSATIAVMIWLVPAGTRVLSIASLGTAANASLGAGFGGGSAT